MLSIGWSWGSDEFADDENDGDGDEDADISEQVIEV